MEIFINQRIAIVQDAKIQERFEHMGCTDGGVSVRNCDLPEPNNVSDCSGQTGAMPYHGGRRQAQQVQFLPHVRICECGVDATRMAGRSFSAIAGGNLLPLTASPSVNRMERPTMSNETIKRLILLAVFIVTWKEYEAKYQPATVTYVTYPATDNGGCFIYEQEHEKQFDDEMEAWAFIAGMETDRKLGNGYRFWDLKLTERIDKELLKVKDHEK